MALDRITSLFLEDRAGRWPIAVNWIASLRPARFEYEGRTFDQAGHADDGTWIYRTTQAPKTQDFVGVRLERGVARNFVTEFDVLTPPPDELEYEDATYRRKGLSDGRYLYWHG